MTDDISLSGVELVVQKLIELTQDDKLTWSYTSPKEAPYIRNAENAVFFVDFKEKTLALAKTLLTKRRASTAIDAFIGQYETYQLTALSLMVIDVEKELVLWKTNNSAYIEKLYKSVSFKVSGIENLIEAVLNERKGLAAP